MGDPLSVAASAAGLLSLGLQTTEYLYKYYAAYRDRDQDFARTADRLDDLLQALRVVDEPVRTRTWRPDERPVLQNIESSITHCENVIHELQDEAKKLEKEPSDSWKKKVAAAGRRVGYPFRRSTLEKLQEDIYEFRNNLSFALQALQLKDHYRIQNEIEGITSVLNSVQAQYLGADLRQWLRAPDATVDFNNASAKRHPGTGQWLVQGPAFTTWLQQPNSFLWLYGFAGCGKSVLCSTAIQYAFRRRQSSPTDSAAAFFFFTFNDESKQDASAALRALLLQLCGQVSGLETDLTRLKQSYHHGTPPVSTLLEYLRQAVTRCRHFYLLLDALDESPVDSSRDEVLSMIETIRQWQLPGVHLMVTSRDVPDIRDHLQSSTSIVGGEYVALKNNSIQQDISRYVAFQVDHDRQLQRWGKDQRETIKSHLTQHAGGVFRWVECQLRPLRKCARSENHLRRCLRELPPSLDATYERMLCDIESPADARQILTLLCFATRPLSIDEMVEALAVDANESECYDPRNRFTGGADDLLRICPGLIEISSDYHTGDSDDSKNNNKVDVGVDTNESKVSVEFVRIAHFSVQEYLMSDRIKKSRASEFALFGPSQHGWISKVCLLYLENDDFLQQTLSVGLVEQYTFAVYAAEHWVRHYREADDQVAERLSGKIAAWLSSPRTVERWIRLHDPEYPWNTSIVDGEYTDSARDPCSPTYYASLLGLDSVLVHISSRPAVNVNTQEGLYGYALQAASNGGYEKVVNMLLDRGADVNAQGGGYTNALTAASFSGHEKVVRILLDRGANVNAQERTYGNALQTASRGGYEKVVQILLERGADVNAQGGTFGNVLQAASFGGHEKVVQILLERGADVNIQGGPYGTALQAASYNGYRKVVQVLVEREANISVQGGRYSNALQAASFRGYERVVQIVLERGADVNAQGGPYGTALQAASYNSYRKVVRILLERGADVNAQGGKYGNALTAARKGPSMKVALMLLQAGAKDSQVSQIQ